MQPNSCPLYINLVGEILIHTCYGKSTAEGCRHALQLSNHFWLQQISLVDPSLRFRTTHKAVSVTKYRGKLENIHLDADTLEMSRNAKFTHRLATPFPLLVSSVSSPEKVTLPAPHHLWMSSTKGCFVALFLANGFLLGVTSCGLRVLCTWYSFVF